MSYLTVRPLDLSFSKQLVASCEENDENMAVGGLAGAYSWQERWCGQDDQRTCPFCQCRDTEMEHLWWSCAATAK